MFQESTIASGKARWQRRAGCICCCVPSPTPGSPTPHPSLPHSSSLLPLEWANPGVGTTAPAAHCLGAELPGVNADAVPLGVTGEDTAGEAAGVLARNILAEALSWRSGKAFVPGTCNGFQERASIFAANRGTKDMESYCGLSKEELILGQAALVRRGSSAGRAAGGAVIEEQL